jgi:hypothetical protein
VGERRVGGVCNWRGPAMHLPPPRARGIYTVGTEGCPC